MQGDKPAQALHLLIDLIGLENIDHLAMLCLKRFPRLLIGDMLILHSDGDRISSILLYAGGRRYRVGGQAAGPALIFHRKNCIMARTLFRGDGIRIQRAVFLQRILHLIGNACNRAIPLHMEGNFLCFFHAGLLCFNLIRRRIEIGDDFRLRRWFLILNRRFFCGNNLFDRLLWLIGRFNCGAVRSGRITRFGRACF